MTMKTDKLKLGDELIMDNILDMPLERLKLLNKRISGLIHRKSNDFRMSKNADAFLSHKKATDKNKNEH